MGVMDLAARLDNDVYLIKTDDRTAGIKSLLLEYDLKEFSGKDIAIKANYNSADPFPATTHLQTLESLIENLKKAGASKLVLAERSGMGSTRHILEKMGVFDLGEKSGFKVSVLDEEDKEEWVKIRGDNNHWLRGFYISRKFLEADKVVQTCCLKTHRFGGHFTLSLKNSVGLVAKKLPGSIYNYMGELHLSPHQRKMIAEINQHYQVDLILMDGMKAFLNKGPERGIIAEPHLLLASKDRVAIDAVGVAILRYYGTTDKVSKGPIFDQDQIRRASELDIGVKSADEINLVPVDDESREISEELTSILDEKG
jgi:uncharacterized protein (DUF362 family)